VERYASRVSKLRSWPIGPVLLTALGLMVAGIPEDFEGPNLINFGTAQGLDLTNAAAVALLLSGTVSLIWGGWRHAGQLAIAVQKHTLAIVLLSVLFAAGIFLLLLSGTSTAVSLWAPGTVMVVTALLGISLKLTCPSRHSTP